MERLYSIILYILFNLQFIYCLFTIFDSRRYNKHATEQKLRIYISPMTGGFFRKSEDSPSLLASYSGEKLRVWNADDGSKMFKFRSSRGSIPMSLFICVIRNIFLDN